MHALFKVIIETVNRLLKLDPANDERLHALEGCVVRVRVGDAAPYALDLHIAVSAGGFHLVTADHRPDVTLSGGVVNLVRLLRAGAAGEIAMEGDAEVARQLGRALSRLRIDWEEGLARALGDVPAHKMGNVIRTLAIWARDTGGTGAANL